MLYRKSFTSASAFSHTNKRYVVAKAKKGTVSMLNKLFYECQELNGDELYLLCKGRKLQFSQTDYQVELLVYQQAWQVDKRTWSGMADILNSWSVGDQVREKIKTMKDEELLVIPLVIPDYLRMEDEDNLMEL
jgi:hypothetical protein